VPDSVFAGCGPGQGKEQVSMWQLVGNHYRFPPEPYIPEHTRFVDAACIKIGVEYRHLDAGRVLGLHDGDQFEEIYRQHRERSTMSPADTGGPDGNQSKLVGVSLHVVDSESGHEYLRFDCFDEHPHYHYLHPWSTPEDCDNHCVQWDPVAHGPMTPWALERLRTRLGEMLTEAGGPDLATRLDPAETARAVDAVEQIVAAALAGSSR
jgi:hypothetical protein